MYVYDVQHMCTYMHVCDGQRLTLGVVFNFTLLYFLRQGLSLNTELYSPSYYSWLVCPRDALSLFVCGGSYRQLLGLLNFYVGSANLNSGFRTCIASILYSSNV